MWFGWGDVTLLHRMNGTRIGTSWWTLSIVLFTESIILNKQRIKKNEINIINHGDKIKQNFFLNFQSDEMPNEMSEYSLDWNCLVSMWSVTVGFCKQTVHKHVLKHSEWYCTRCGGCFSHLGESIDDLLNIFLWCMRVHHIKSIIKMTNIRA